MIASMTKAITSLAVMQLVEQAVLGPQSDRLNASVVPCTPPS